MPKNQENQGIILLRTLSKNLRDSVNSLTTTATYVIITETEKAAFTSAADLKTTLDALTSKSIIRYAFRVCK